MLVYIRGVVATAIVGYFCYRSVEGPVPEYGSGCRLRGEFFARVDKHQLGEVVYYYMRLGITVPVFGIIYRIDTDTLSWILDV